MGSAGILSPSIVLKNQLIGVLFQVVPFGMNFLSSQKDKKFMPLLVINYPGN